MTILARNLWRSDFFSDPVRVLSIGRNPIQVLLIQSGPIRSGFVNPIRSDPVLVLLTPVNKIMSYIAFRSREEVFAEF